MSALIDEYVCSPSLMEATNTDTRSNNRTVTFCILEELLGWAPMSQFNILICVGPDSLLTESV